MKPKHNARLLYDDLAENPRLPYEQLCVKLLQLLLAVNPHVMKNAASLLKSD